MRHASRKGISLLSTVLVAGLLVFVLTSASAEAAPLPTASNSTGTWSYGIVKTVTVPLQHAGGGWLYSGNATFGYTVTIYENSTSSTTFELTVYRTMGFAYNVRFCYLSCGSPAQWANQSFRIFEATATFANFTSAGTVLANGSGEVPAIALENTTSFLHANLTESTDAFLPMAGWMGPHHGYLAADLTANVAVNFTPALGLVPIDLASDSTWTSSSEFSALGAAAWNYYYAMHRPVGQFILGPISGHESLSANGTVNVEGSYAPDSTFQYGGSTYPAIMLTVSGPFDVREGVIFVPTSVDVFGSSSQPWGDNATGAASATMGKLDLKPGASDRLQPVASSWEYSTGAANAANSAMASPMSGDLSAASTTSNPVSSGTVQGLPETADQANGAQQCLTTGGSCPGGTTGPNLRALIGLIVLSGVVATVAVLVAVAVVSRRRRTPPPVYPNAVLYPPGAAYPSAPAGTPAPPAAPPPPEDDPLDHLW